MSVVSYSSTLTNRTSAIAGQRKKRAAPPPPIARPLPSAISTQGLTRILDSDESLTSDMELSKPSSDIEAALATGGSSSSKASSELGGCRAAPPAAPVEPARVVKKGKPVLRKSHSAAASLRRGRKILVRVPTLGSLGRPRLGHSLSFQGGELPRPRDRPGAAPPPPLSNLHIFAISTRPEDIQLAPMEEALSGEFDRLPSLPCVERAERGREPRLSILEPPPPGLVSREESSENWARFLLRLNAILESRAGEFV